MPARFKSSQHEREKFLRARLNDLVEHADKHGARRTIAHAGDLDGLIFGKQVAQGAAVFALDALRFGNRRAQTDGQIVAEVIAANGHGAGMTDHAAGIDDQLSRTAADIKQAAAELAFILREHGDSAEAKGSSAVSLTTTPARLTAVTTFCVAVIEVVTM